MEGMPLQPVTKEQIKFNNSIYVTVRFYLIISKSRVETTTVVRVKYVSSFDWLLIQINIFKDS